MANDSSTDPGDPFRLSREVDPSRDHVRGRGGPDAVNVVAYADFLCPYCRRLRPVIARLRKALGERFVYVFRHFPNERAHPGAELVARASEAAARQGRFWELHDWIYKREPPVGESQVLDFARSLGLDMDRFVVDMRSDEARRRVEEDLADGRRNGVTGTPTLFVDGVRYDGAWDFYSMLEALERPVAARVKRSARVFASLPASAGLVLLLAAAAALLCANTPLAPLYRSFVESRVSLGPLSLSVATWCSEGLLAIFFLLVGLEIRREMTAGALTDRRAALLPVVAAVGGVLAPAAIYLALNRGATAHGWSVPTATDVAFSLGILALMGDRVPSGLRVFVAALAVVDDVLSVLTLAVFYPRSFDVAWLVASGVAVVLLLTLNRWRVFAKWPYVLVTAVLWLALHRAGVHASLAGVILAAFLPTQPAPAAGPLLAQAATALAELEHAERERAPGASPSVEASAGEETSRAQEQPMWDWASRNLSAASERLLSPADRIERAVAPWSSYVILPLFAFTATGVHLTIDFSGPDTGRILAGIIVGLVVGKPLGISVASWLATKSGVAAMAESIRLWQFLGAACLCGVSDTVALLLADQAFARASDAAVAKIAVLTGSVLAAALGTLVLLVGAHGSTEATAGRAPGDSSRRARPGMPRPKPEAHSS